MTAAYWTDTLIEKRSGAYLNQTFLALGYQMYFPAYFTRLATESDNRVSRKGIHVLISIENYDDKDEHRLKRLFALSFEEEGLLNLLQKPKNEFAYSAFAEGQLAGVIFGWKSSFHPNCIYFRIVSDPFYTADGIGEKLLAAVEREAAIESPLQTSIWETAAALKDTYEKKNFNEIRRTYMPILQLSKGKGEFPIDTAGGHMIRTLAELPDDMVNQLVLLVKSNYEETHRANPVADKELDEWKDLIFASDVISEGSFICLDALGKEIAAYSFLHESDREESYELGWCGWSASRYKRAIPQLIIRHIHYAIDHNVKTIIGEFDTTDPCAMEVMRKFPFAPCPALITYQKTYFDQSKR